MPPDTGIVHQVNLEYLAPVVFTNKTASGRRASLSRHGDGHRLAHHDDQRPWGRRLGRGRNRSRGLHAWAADLDAAAVGGRIQVEGQAARKAPPPLTWCLPITQMLRAKGCGRPFVEFYGAGVSALSLADRATIANMAPEYGATIGFFPIDDQDARLSADDQPSRRI